jgi:hypothetical protein
VLAPNRDKCFHDTQRLAGWAFFPMALLGTLVVFFTVGEMASPFNWLNAEFASFIAVAFFGLMAMLRIENEVGKDQIQYGIAPLYRRHVSASEIRNVSIRTVPAQEIYVSRGAKWRMEGGHLVELELDSGRKIFLTSGYPVRLKDAIQEMLDASRRRH